MEPQYLNVSLDSNRATAGIMSLAQKYLEKLPKDIPTKKKRGGLNEITDLRLQTAKFLGITIGQVQGLTKNWSIHELFTTLKTAKGFTKNPQALWWVLYKKNKDNYGRSNKKVLLKNREERGKENSTERQGTLFRTG